jgi:DNA replication ATP-dependent helicase Dna2
VFSSLPDIRAAIDAELAATPEFFDFRVRHTARDGALWRVTLESGVIFAEGQRPGQASAQVLLDEGLDGASAWWGAPSKGGASVLAVVIEDDELILQNASSPPPGAGRLIRLYPSRFLTAIAEAWNDRPWAERAFAKLSELSRPHAMPAAVPLTGEPFRWLRTAQRDALAIVAHSAAFLWGPPGTGKTTTLGVLVAEYLERHPSHRVLLLSTTNQAVDIATIAVDKALQKGRREALRGTVQRLGARFDASAYAGREHLIPSADADLVARLARAEAARPSSRDAAAMKAWADRLARLRDALRGSSLEVLRRARLASMTTTRAAFTLKTLRELSADDEPPFDLVVFDEASQVSLAHTLALMPLARACLFAGDPEQLSPIVRSDDRLARKWLGRSAFAETPVGRPSVAMLDEQSRMAGPINELVSDMFYNGALRVAADAQAAIEWLAARQRPFGDIDAATHVTIRSMQTSGSWSATERGPVRRESAAAIADLVAGALASGEWRPDEIIVLTPFRAQRALIRRQLAERGVPESVKASTVHRAQGSEAAVVLFDPADGTQPFLQSDEARRLLNVALSRAQAKVVMFLSSADTTNPLFAAVAQRLRLAGDARQAIPLLQLAAARDFPCNAIGRRVQAGRHTGEVSRASPDGRQFWLVNEKTGAEQPIDVAFWRAKAALNSE